VSADHPILPGATLGMLGGGQLGRMFALAAREMGYRIAVLDPDPDSPAAQVADHVEVGAYDDVDAVARLCRSGVSVLTFEFENVPAAAVTAAERFVPVRPGGGLLAAAQHRVREKRAVAEFGLPTPRFAPIENESDVGPALAHTGTPAVLKTTTLGYDGKGQARVRDAGDGLEAFRSLGGKPCIAEELVSFEREISVVGARGLDGEIALYEPFANRHTNHILDITTSPAPVSSRVRDEAHGIARGILEGFDVVGVLCVELFVTHDERVLVNEIAPRPHNSGHLTIDAHVTSQFEQQVRAVCGLPLGDVRQLAPGAAMANLLGDLWGGAEHDVSPDWAAALREPRVRLHLYGKARARKGRKMGHLTATGRDLDAAERHVVRARDLAAGR
jgi:5-(carboxyamino)imidazole ribonucleotide synthase